MNVPHPSKFFLQLAVILCAGCTSLGAANQPPTALLALKGSNTSDEFASVLEYSKVEFESAVALRVVLPSGQTSSVTKDQIGGQFRYPDPMVALTATDSPSLAAKRTEAVALATKFPNTRSALQRVVAGIDADLQRLAAGQVRYRGVWQLPGSFTPSSGTNPNLLVDFASLVHQGVTYRQVELTRLDNGSVVIKHDGGIARLLLVDASAELLAKIRGKASLLGGVTRAEELVVDGTKLTDVVAVGLQGDTMLLLHHTGVTRIRTSQLPRKVLENLISLSPVRLPRHDMEHSTPLAAGAAEPTRDAILWASGKPQTLEAQARGLGIALAEYTRLAESIVLSVVRDNNPRRASERESVTSAAMMMMPEALRLARAAVTANESMREYDEKIEAVSIDDAAGEALAGMLNSMEANVEAVAATHAAYSRENSPEERSKLRHSLITTIVELARQDRYKVLAALPATPAKNADVQINAILTADKLQRFFGILDVDTQQIFISTFERGESDTSVLAKHLRSRGYDEQHLGRSPDAYARELANDNQSVRKQSGGVSNLGTLLHAARRKLGETGADMFANKQRLMIFDRAVEKVLSAFPPEH